MVHHYHSHLYKEYVLADLSRVLSDGGVGLRWRTENEVKSGRGFTSCGNLACRQNVSRDDAEYVRRARSSLGVGVAENGGNIPTGVLLPSSEADDAIEVYLQSCEREGRRHKRRRERKEHKKKRSKRSRKEQDSSREQEKKEAKEQKRLYRIPYGIGLHDYEVDFAYVEQLQKKRELDKVRLCLRCAPLIFDGKAVKARLAREKAVGLDVYEGGVSGDGKAFHEDANRGDNHRGEASNDGRNTKCSDSPSSDSDSFSSSDENSLPPKGNDAKLHKKKQKEG